MLLAWKKSRLELQKSKAQLRIESELLDGIQSVGDLLDVLETKIFAKSVRRAA